MGAHLSPRVPGGLRRQPPHSGQPVFHAGECGLAGNLYTGRKCHAIAVHFTSCASPKLGHGKIEFQRTIGLFDERVARTVHIGSDQKIIVKKRNIIDFYGTMVKCRRYEVGILRYRPCVEELLLFRLFILAGSVAKSWEAL